MEHDPDKLPEPKVYKGRLYKVRSVYLATIVGGPLAAAYIIGHNFRTLGDRKKMQRTWLFLVLFYLIMLVAASFFGYDLNLPFAIISLLIAVNTMNKYQEKEIETYTKAGHASFPTWYGFVIGLMSLSLVIFIIILVGS